MTRRWGRRRARADAQPTSVAQQILRWQVVIVVVLVLGAVLLAWLDARADATAAARQRALDLAVGVADAPTVREAVATEAADPTSEPTAVLQPFAEQVRRDSGTDFVVIMSPDGIRWTHPDPDVIGERFLGSISGAQQGRRTTEVYTGTLGRSVRAVVPVLRDDGTAQAGPDDVVALVSVGIRTERVQDDVVEAVPRISAAAAAVGALGVLGAWLVHRRLRRQTHGLGENEITRMYEYYDAVLHAVREGLVLVDADGNVSLVNAEAERLLEVRVGARSEDLGLGDDVTTALRERGTLDDVTVALADRLLVVNAAPATWQGRDVGSVVTIRDRTELQSVTAELDTVRSLADSLRSHSHETANRLHTMVSLVEMGRTTEAVDLATRDIRLAQGLTDSLVTAVDEPVLAALLLGKSAQANERGVRLEVDPASVVTGLPVSAHDAVTVVGNLVDNAIDAVQSAPGEREPTVLVLLHASEEHLDVRVEDNGPGVPETDREHVFERGWSTKADGTDPDRLAGRGLGLALVGQVVRRHGGSARVGDGPLGGAVFEVEIGDDA